MDPDVRRRIVVGVDGSDSSRAALRRAAEEAAAHAAKLEVVHAWNFLDQPGSRFDVHYGEDEAAARIRRFVDETLLAQPADVTVSVVNDLPAHALLGRASGSFTLVVGARGHKGFGSLMLGSVSKHVVLHAACPVLVVHGAHTVAQAEPAAR